MTEIEIFFTTKPRHVSNYPYKKRKRENRAKKKEEQIIFLYFCTKKVKKKEKNQNPKRGNQLKKGSLTCLKTWLTRASQKEKPAGTSIITKWNCLHPLTPQQFIRCSLLNFDMVAKIYKSASHVKGQHLRRFFRDFGHEVHFYNHAKIKQGTHAKLHVCEKGFTELTPYY